MSEEVIELLERYRRGAELVAAVTTGAAGVELDHSAGDGKWTVRQILCHLSDSECVGTMRLRQVIAEDNPTIQWFDEQAWAVKTDYSKRKLSVALETFRRMRGENYELLKDQPDSAWSRKGTHSKYSEKTLLDLLRTYAEHAEAHARQLRDARAAYKELRLKQSS